MGNQKLSVVVRSTLALFAVLAFAACSDGAHVAAPAIIAPSVAKPEIVKFQISKVGGTEAPSSSTVVASGDSVLLEWEVTAPTSADDASADSVEPKGATAPAVEGGVETPAADAEKPASTGVMITLDSEALGLHLEGLDAVGSYTAEAVSADATFVLTVSDGVEVDLREVSVTVGTVAAQNMDATFTVTPAEIFVGDSAELCWTVSRSDAVYSVIDENGETIAESGSSDEGSETAKAAEAVPADDGSYVPPAVTDALSKCVTVTPEKTTTYHLTAIADGAPDVRKDVTLTVSETVVIESFDSASEKSETPSEVTLRWKVKPANAVVTIAGVDGVFGAEDSVVVSILERTTFELTAKVPGCDSCVATRSITIEPQGFGGALSMTLSGSKVIFAGEEAEITWSVASATGTALPSAAVMVKGGDYGDAGSPLQPVGSIKVRPTETTKYTFLASAPGATALAPQEITIAVRSWKGPGAEALSVNDSTQKTNAVSAVSFSPMQNDVVYVGYEGKFGTTTDDAGKVIPGVLRIGKGIGEGPIWSDVVLPYMNVFPKIDPEGSNNFAFFNMFDYPVNAIVTDSASGRMYAGTTGAVFFSDNGGAKWETLIGLVISANVPVPRATCKGGTMAGWPDQGQIHGFSQVCDMVIASDDRLIVATDYLVEYLPSGKSALADWNGHTTSASGNVNHDLELARINDREVLFVGTARGVLRSTDLGDSYEQLSGVGSPTGDIYGVKVDVANSKLYAGGADGQVYTCKLVDYDCVEWTSSSVGGSSGPIYSIALDPVQAGAVFLATGNGILYSEEGSNWRDVSSGAIRSGLVVKSLDTKVTTDGKTGHLFVGTSDGVFKTSSEIISRRPAGGAVTSNSNLM